VAIKRAGSILAPDLFVEFSRVITVKNIKFVIALPAFVVAQFCSAALILYRIKTLAVLPAVITM
jgi:hypothetical protein